MISPAAMAVADSDTIAFAQHFLPNILSCVTIIVATYHPQTLFQLLAVSASLYRLPMPTNKPPNHTDLRGNQQARQRAWRRGWWAEQVALLWLYSRGYRLVARRYRTPVGEIDLILRKRGCWHFVEVKYRQQMNAALAALSPRQGQRVRRAASWYLTHKRLSPSTPCCFSLLALSPWHWPRLVYNAW